MTTASIPVASLKTRFVRTDGAVPGAWAESRM